MKSDRRRVARISSIPLAVMAIAMSVAGCGAKDGSTTCNDYLDMDNGDQQETVQNMIKNTNQTDSGGNMLLTMGSVKLYCMVHPADSRIDGIYTG